MTALRIPMRGYEMRCHGVIVITQWLRIPMRGYETTVPTNAAHSIKLRIPMRGYEISQFQGNLSGRKSYESPCGVMR